MTYTITTTTPYTWQGNGPNSEAGTTRDEVATLDAAKTAAFREMIAHWPNKRVGEGPNLTKMRASGITIGPLSDGTVIKVETTPS